MTLDEYLRKTDQTTASFADKIGVHRGTLARYRYSGRMPNADIVRKIQDATNREVTFDDFPSKSEPGKYIKSHLKTAIVEAHEAGATVAEIAKDKGLHYNTVHRVLKKHQAAPKG